MECNSTHIPLRAYSSSIVPKCEILAITHVMLRSWPTWKLDVLKECAWITAISTCSDAGMLRNPRVSVRNAQAESQENHVVGKPRVFAYDMVLRHGPTTTFSPTKWHDLVYEIRCFRDSETSVERLRNAYRTAPRNGWKCRNAWFRAENLGNSRWNWTVLSPCIT